MKKPEDYKCHSSLEHYILANVRVADRDKVIFKKEDLIKIFEDAGFTPWTKYRCTYYSKDGVTTNTTSNWTFNNDVTLNWICNVFLMNIKTNAKIRYEGFKCFGDFVLYELLENYYHWSENGSYFLSQWELNEGVTFKQVLNEFVPRMYECLKEHIEQSVIKITLKNKKQKIKENKQSIENDVDLKIMSYCDELKKSDFEITFEENPQNNISKKFTILKKFVGYNGMINPQIEIRKNINGNYDILTNICKENDFDKFRQLPKDGEKIINILDALIGDYIKLPVKLIHSNINILI